MNVFYCHFWTIQCVFAEYKNYFLLKKKFERYVYIKISKNIIYQPVNLKKITYICW